MTETRTRGRRQLVLMAAFFWGPLFAAAIIYYGFDWRPAGTTENGELIRPQQLLPDTVLGEERGGRIPSFRKRWTIVIAEQSGCPEQCQAVLYETRQVREALSGERDRTQRVLLIDGPFDRETIEIQHPDLIIVTRDSAVATELGNALAVMDADHIYLVDPLGNLMMRFPRDTGMKGIHTDLKKLLKLSRIG